VTVRLAESFAALPEPANLCRLDWPQEGGHDDMLDTEGFWLDPVLTGNPETHHRVIGLRYVFGESIEHDPHALKAIFVLGSGGSGKGSIGREMFGGRGLKHIDQDKHLERFYKEAGKPLSRIGDDYGLFKKAQGLARKERDWHAKRRRGLLIDMTGWDFARVSTPVQSLRGLGYDVYAVIVVTKLKTALDRNLARAEAGGRKVPKSYIQTAHHGLKKNLPRYIKLFGKANTVVIDNDEPLDPTHWQQVVAPELARAGDALLRRPLKNKTGQKWLQKQIDALKVETAERPTIVVPTSVRFDSDLPAHAGGGT